MRIQIKTHGRVKDNDVKALYLLQKAMELSSDRMRLANVNFIAAKWKLK